MTPELKIWIGKVKVELARQDLNQSKLAKALGVSRPLISDLFNYGKGSQKLITSINKFLGIK
jgi:predicted XRE-type DNA-binding protein